ncbi:MAG: ATP-binding protein, partial [Pseudomonadota bacterium]
MITDADFSRKLAKTIATAHACAKPHFLSPIPVLACSGGPDSMALAVLFHRWAQAQQYPTIILIVDHGISDDSARICANAARQLHKMGMHPHILQSGSPLEGGNLQARARRLRYTLMADWCRR